MTASVEPGAPPPLVPPGSRESASRVAAALRVHTRRADAPRASEIVYLLYAGVLVTAVLGSGLVRVAVTWLLDPSSIATLTQPGTMSAWATGSAFAGGSGTIIATIAGALVALAILIGRLHGPASRRPWFVAALGFSDLPLHVSLRRPVALAFFVIAITAAAGVAAPAFVLAATGEVAVGAAVLLTVAGAMMGLVLAGAWLLGQSVRASTAAWSAIAIVALTIATAIAPIPGGIVGSFAVGLQPWAALGAVWTNSIGGATAIAAAWLSWTPLIPLTLAALTTALAAPALLDHMDPHALLAQSRRNELARTLGSTGDIAGGAGVYRSFPHAARRFRAAPVASGALAVLTRDIVGALRTPGRFTTATVATLAGGGLLTLGSASGNAVLTALGALVAFLASSAWCDGLRHAADAAGRPALYGIGVVRLAASHTAALFACALVLLLLGTLGAAALGALETAAIGTDAGAAFLLALSASAAFAALLAAVRAYDAARPPLPVLLLMPVPTPVGDLSILNVLLWQSDAVLLAAALPALVVTFASGPVAPVAIALAAAVVAGLAARRFRRS